MRWNDNGDRGQDDGTDKLQEQDGDKTSESHFEKRGVGGTAKLRIFKMAFFPSEARSTWSTVHKGCIMLE